MADGRLYCHVSFIGIKNGFETINSLWLAAPPSVKPFLFSLLLPEFLFRPDQFYLHRLWLPLYFICRWMHSGPNQQLLISGRWKCNWEFKRYDHKHMWNLYLLWRFHRFKQPEAIIFNYNHPTTLCSQTHYVDDHDRSMGEYRWDISQKYGQRPKCNHLLNIVVDSWNFVPHSWSTRELSQGRCRSAP